MPAYDPTEQGYNGVGIGFPPTSVVSFGNFSQTPTGVYLGDTYFTGTTFKTYGAGGFFLDFGQYIGSLPSQIVTRDNLNSGINGVYGSVTTYLISGSGVIGGAGIGSTNTLARSDHTHDTTGIALLSVANSWNGSQNFLGGVTTSRLSVTPGASAITISKGSSVSNTLELYPYDPGTFGTSSIPLWYIDQYGLTTMGNNARYVDLGATLFVQSTGSSSTALVLSAFNSSWVGDLQRWLIPLGAFTQQIGSTVNSKGQFVIGGSVALISTSAAMLSVYNSSSNTPGLIIRGSINQNVNLSEWQNSSGASVVTISPTGIISAASFVGATVITSSVISSSAIFASSATYSSSALNANTLNSINSSSYALLNNTSFVGTSSFANIYATGNVVYNQATNAQSAASYTLVISDSGKFVEMNNAALNYLIIPSNANAGFGIGSRIDVIQTGAGTTVLSASTGVTLNFYSPTSATSASFSGSWAAVTLVKRATDTWAAIGNIK